MQLGMFLEFPRPSGASYREAFDSSFALVDEAESLGVDSVWLAEYHFNPGRVLSSPILIATAIASRTERIRMGLAVQCLPLGHPVRLAEEAATLDQLSNGRLEYGVGRGTFPNVHEGFNTPFAESRGRFEESLEVIKKAWTEETFSFEGEFFQIRDLCVEPKPVQDPHPPIRVGITSAESFPITGRMGFPILINPSRVFTFDELAAHIDAYRKAWREAGHEGEPEVGLRVPIYVAETEEKAYSDPREGAVFMYQRLGNRVMSYAEYGATTGDWQAEADRILGMEYDDWLRDKVAYGTPDQVAERIGQLRDSLGLTQFIYEIDLGNQLPHELQLNSLRLFNQEVVPLL
ncbi:MAG: LLM class flavin-dependent oxidoreductase [Chloroflexota bacterium]|nr:LLM class flavin-dependent oxidoreductase [Chloroflexota bacterium]